MTRRRHLPKIITIDGPAASGKSSIGRLLAERLGYLYFDTGVMYRAVTYAALEKGLDISDELAITNLAEHVKIDVKQPSQDDGRMADVLVDGKEVTWKIRQPDVESAVSPVSAYKGVRKALTVQQRRIGNSGSVVMVGRDIGTVVLPDADVKFYLEASVEERARRRFKENKARGKSEDYREILSSMKERDRIDSTRLHAPLKPAPDAIVINTDDRNQDAVLKKMLGLIENRENSLS